MASRGCSVPILALAVLVLVISPSATVLCATFTFTNNCGYTVWPGLLSNAGTAQLPTTGFSLQKGETRTVSAPSNWSGRMWGRTLCTGDPSSSFTCATGDCGSGKLECSGGGAAPPATLAEFTLSGSNNQDFYDVSLVDGYNIPMLVVPQGGGSSSNSNGSSSSCMSTGCLVDLNGLCPNDLRVMSASGGQVDGGVAACKSACEAFGKPEYCCSGSYGNPNTCKPSSYSMFFKNACPRAYSYAYDDGTSTFTCSTGANYIITFCPTTSSQKTSGENPQAVLPLVNSSMVYLGGELVESAAPAITKVASTSLAVAGFTTVLSFLVHL